MSRFDRLEALKAELEKGRKPAPKKEEPKIDLDLDKDGKIEPEELKAVEKEVKKRKKKVVKQDD